MSTFLADVRGGLAALNEAAGNPSVAKELEARNEEERGNKLKLALAPLSQALNADQTRLSIYADPDDPSKAVSGKEKEYQAALDNMTSTIGQMRSVLGQKEPHHGILDSLHIRRDLQNRVAGWNAQNSTQAQEYARGALPYGQTQPGQEQAQKTADAIKVIQAHNASAGWTPKGNPVKAGDSWFQPFTSKTGETKMEPMPEGYTGPTAPPETEYQKSLTDYRNKALAFNESKQKAASDPNNPIAKAAVLRAQGEAERSHAYMIRAMAGAKGVDLSGNPLPGALETPSGTPIGSMFSSNFYKSAQGMAQLNDAQGAIDQVGSAVDKLFSSGGSLADPKVATALANPQWTAAKLAQGIVGQGLSPEEREAVVAIRSAQENIQGMRKAAGGGLSNEQVNRLEAQLPGPNTPNLEFAKSQLEYLNLTLSRLSQGVPAAEGGATFHGAEGPTTKKNRAAQKGKWTSPPDAPAAPKQDGKLLKSDGKVIAKSKGGEWVQP